ncbi:hypothetical protein [Pseudoalteromonas obscura]|nr:hypothetical protein [Pseudoalteromonas sp. P94(2023)]
MIPCSDLGSATYQDMLTHSELYQRRCELQFDKAQTVNESTA